MPGDFRIPQCFTVARVEPVLAKPKFHSFTNKVTFIWGESCCGQKKHGPQTAPPLVCSDEFLEKIVKPLGWEPSILRVNQIFKPSPPESPCFQPSCVAETCMAIRHAVDQAVTDSSFPIMIGGDHCLSMGSVLASAQRHKDLIVLWFDAHADINTPETSPSGNMHGMPVAALLGLEAMKQAAGFSEGEFTCLSPDRLGYVGLRDVDPGELETIKALGISTAYNMDDLARDGIKRQVQKLLDKLNPNRDKPIHISFDVDGMDPLDAPSTGTPVPGGLRLHEAIDMVREIRETGCLVSFDVVEVNPALGSPQDVQVTITNARWIIANALGHLPPVVPIPSDAA